MAKEDFAAAQSALLSSLMRIDASDHELRIRIELELADCYIFGGSIKEANQVFLRVKNDYEKTSELYKAATPIRRLDLTEAA